MTEMILPPPHPPLDSITRLLGERFGADIVLISDPDHVPLAAHHWPLTLSLRVPDDLVSADMLILTDTRGDARFEDFETQTGFPVGFYAASALKAPDGTLLGHVCLLGHQPRTFERQHHQALLDGLCVISDYLEQQRNARRAARVETELLPYRSGVETLADAIIGINGGGSVIYANRAAETLFARPLAQLEHQPIQNLIAGGLSELPEAVSDRWVLGHAEGLRGDGLERLTLEVAARRTQVDPNGMTLLIRDVSAYEHTLASLNASQLQNEALLRAIPDTLLILSKDGVVLSQKAEDGTDIHRVGRNVYELWPIEVADQMMLYLRMVQRGDPVIRTFSFREQGEPPQQFEARLIPMNAERALLVLRSQSMDRALEKTAQQYMALMESSADGVALLDHQQNLWYLNPELLRRLGQRDQQLLGQHWSVLFPEGDRDSVVPAIGQALDHRDHWNGQVDLIGPDGPFRQELALSAFEDHNMVLVAHNFQNLANEGREPEGEELLDRARQQEGTGS